MTFRVRGTERIADAGFLAVDRVTIEAADGSAHDRVVVRHPGAVVVIPVVDGREAVLVRQYRASVDGLVLEVVAGKRDVDGEPPAAAAARELEEEVGMRAGRLVLLAEFYNTPGFCDEYSYVFLADGLVDLGARNSVSPEEDAMTIERVALADVEQLIASRVLVDGKAIIGLLLARQYLAGDFTGIAAEDDPAWS